jgi:hypothetical protein
MGSFTIKAGNLFNAAAIFLLCSCGSNDSKTAAPNMAAYQAPVFIDTVVKKIDTVIITDTVRKKTELPFDEKKIQGTWAFSDYFDEAGTRKILEHGFEGMYTTAAIRGEITFYKEGYSKLSGEIIFYLTNKETNEERSVKLSIGESTTWRVVQDKLEETTIESTLNAENDLAREIISGDSLSFEALRPVSGETKRFIIRSLTDVTMELEDEDDVRITFRKK